jgi:competence protein ComEC
MLDSTKPGLEPIRESIRRAGVSVREVSSEQQYFDGWSSSQIEILHPPRNRVSGNDNANSLVIRIDHQGTSLVLPGDLEPPGLEMVIRSPRPPAGGVLMSPHHGSLTVDSQFILAWARPREVIVSGGARARRPEVADALGVRGSGVHVTATLGAVRVEFSATDISKVRSASGKSESKGRRAKPRTVWAEGTTRRGVDRPAQPSTRVTIRSWRKDPW